MFVSSFDMSFHCIPRLDGPALFKLIDDETVFHIADMAAFFQLLDSFLDKTRAVEKSHMERIELGAPVKVCGELLEIWVSADLVEVKMEGLIYLGIRVPVTAEKTLFLFPVQIPQ